MLPLIVPAQDVRVRGVVVGVLRKFGFAGGREKAPAKTAPRATRRLAARDDATLDLEINAIDSQLARWRSLLTAESLDEHDRVRMASLGRDLQALRDWCARTAKPSLRRALLIDANQLIQRMQRFLKARTIDLPEPTLH
jgi:hypothetical protein